MTRYAYNITLFADASTSPHDGTSGWGSWMIGNDPARASLGVHGPLPFHATPHVCELRALVCALEFAREDGFLRDTDRRVMLQSDATTALGVVLALYPGSAVNAHKDSAKVERAKRGLDQYADERDRLLAVLDPQRVTVHVRHVCGHTNGSGRKWVNRECDRLAKAGRKLTERRVDWRNAAGVAA